MVILYVLLYLFGSLLVFFGGRSAMRDALSASSLEGLSILAFGVGMVVAAAALQIYEVRRRGDSALPEERPELPLKLLTLAFLAWSMPLTISWIQFERHVNPIYFFPWLTVGGAVAVVWVAVRWGTWRSQYSNVVSTLLVALIGLPFGAFSVEALNSHFHHHLTDLRIIFYNHDTELMDTRDFEAPEPVFYARDPGVGAQMGELFDALSDAKPVDIWQEIDQGRAKIDEDGETILWLRDGKWVASTPLNEAALEEAAAADAQEHAKKEAIRRAAFNRELELRRQGGRLFSSPN